MADLDTLIAALQRVKALLGESDSAVSASHDALDKANVQAVSLGSQGLITGVTAARQHAKDCGDGVVRTRQDIEALIATAQAAKTGAYHSGPAPAVSNAAAKRILAGRAGPVTLNPPNRRHHLGKITKSSRPGHRNTVILSGVDVNSDLEAIRDGRARWDSETGRYHVNGRTWGVEPNGTVFPDQGAGFVTLNRPQYQALKGVVAAKGDKDNLPVSLTRNPSISGSDWDTAFEVYRRGKDNVSQEGQ